MTPSACYLIFDKPPWDVGSDTISPHGKGPPALKQLKGYALEDFPLKNGRPDLSSIKESVIIVDKSATMSALGLFSDPRTACGMYQPLSSEHKVVLLPWADKDKRRQRSEMWRQYFVHAVSRACRVARGDVPAVDWGTRLTGEGIDVLRALRAFLANPEPLAVDVETAGAMPNMIITAIGFAGRDVAVSIPWAPYVSKVFGAQPGLSGTFSEQIRSLVVQLLASEKHTKVFHNGGFDRAVFKQLGMPCGGAFEDTILQMKIIFPELYRNLQFSAGLAGLFDPWKDGFKATRKKGLEQHARQIKELKKALGLKDWKVLKDWAEIPIEALLEYNCKDAAATIRLWYYLNERLPKVHAWEPKYRKLRALADMAADQWLYGVAIDLDQRNAFLESGKLKLAELVEEWTRIVGPGIPPFGPGSDAAQRKYFFETLRAPVEARSPETQEPSMNTYTLTCWEGYGRQPLSDAAFTLFRIRKLQKNLQAFLEPLKVRRVHPNGNVTGTVGTRFTYSEPNLAQWAKDQTATRYTTKEEVKLAPNVRKLVVAKPGCVLIEADFNALEARANGYRTKNQLWFDWMRADLDMHVQHVFLMYGIRLHRKGCAAEGCAGGSDYCTGKKGGWDDKDGLRQITKVVTFNRFYNKKGTSKAAVKQLKAKMPSLTEQALDEVYARFDKAIPNIAQWHIDANKTDRQNGYIETGAGGWRLPVGSKPDDNRNRSFEIQSTVGDIVCDAMLTFDASLDKSRDQRFLFNVYDAFLAECRDTPEEIQEVGWKMVDAMQAPIADLWGYKNVILPVDPSVGKSWGSMVKLKLEPRNR